MAEKNESMRGLIDDIDAQLSAENVDIKNIRALLTELNEQVTGLEKKAEHGEKFKEDFRKRLLSRAKAVDILRKEKNMVPFVEDALADNDKDFEKLIRLREYVNRQFNSAFEISERGWEPESHKHRIDFSHFKC